MTRSAFTVRMFAATAAVLLVSACGSTTSTPTAAPKATSPSTATTSGGALGVATTSLGPVLVDSSGMTVYLLTADTPGHSTCSAECLKFWPPVPAPSGKVPSVSGVSAPLGVTKAANGVSMLTAGGWPLHTFALDKAPGDVHGEGVVNFGGTWYVLSPSGVAVKAAPSSAPATPGGGYGGY